MSGYNSCQNPFLPSKVVTRFLCINLAFLFGVGCVACIDSHVAMNRSTCIGGMERSANDAQIERLKAWWGRAIGPSFPLQRGPRTQPRFDAY